MTEAEWLACTNPYEMLGFLRDELREPSKRKLRLFICACCRRIWDVLPDEHSRMAVEMAEAYADLLIPPNVLVRAHEAATTALYFETLIADLQPGPWSNAPREAASQLMFSNLALEAAEGAAQASATKTSRRERHDVRTRRRAWTTALIAEKRAQSHLLREIFGNPYPQKNVEPEWLAWKGGTVWRLAQEAHDGRSLPSGTLDVATLAVLADALEEAGCTNADILDHCRQPGEHVRGCWVIDLLLGKK
jgi:hypothetical protein